jgi:hypothetical protein
MVRGRRSVDEALAGPLKGLRSGGTHDQTTCLRILRVIFGLLPLLAFARQASIHLAHGFSLTNLFSYFTNISNLYAGCVLLLGALPAKRGVPNRTREILRTLALIDMALAGIVFTVLLRDADVGPVVAVG